MLNPPQHFRHSKLRTHRKESHADHGFFATIKALFHPAPLEVEQRKKALSRLLAKVSRSAAGSRFYKAWYKSMPFIIVLGALGAFYGTIFGNNDLALLLGLIEQTPSEFAPLASDEIGNNQVTAPSQPKGAISHVDSMLSAGLIFIIHLIYLYTVASDQVLRKPAHNVHFVELFLPSLLVFTYIFVAVIEMTAPEAKISNKYDLAKVSSISLFISIYVVWAGHDLYEMFRHGDELSESERGRKRTWFTIDIGLAFFLIIPLIDYLVSPKTATLIDTKTFGFLTLKDLAAATTWVALFGLKFLGDKARRDLTPILHGGWQDSLIPDGSHVGAGPTISPANEATPLRLLFVHADAGRRMDQLLEFFSLTSETRYTSVYNPSRGTKLADSQEVDNYFHTIENAIDEAQAADVIFIVNYLYTPAEIEASRQIVLNAKPGTLVVTRGFADHSYIATIAYQLALNPRQDKTIHEWNSSHTDALFKGYHEDVYVLEERESHEPFPNLWIDGTGHDPGVDEKLPRNHHTEHNHPVPYPPVGIIRQVLDNRAETRFTIANYLVDPLSEASADAVRDQMQALSDLDLGRDVFRDVLNMDDYVYIFRLGDPQPDSPRVYSDKISMQSIG